MLKQYQWIILSLCVAAFTSSCVRPSDKSSGQVGIQAGKERETGGTVARPRETMRVNVDAIYAKGKCLIVDGAHASAADTNPGSPEQPFKTINAAAQKAKAGWTVLVREGVYRERVMPAVSGDAKHPVVFQGVDRARVIVKGSEVWTPTWQVVDAKKGIFQAPVDPVLFKDGVNPYLIGISVSSKDRDIVARPSQEEKLPFTLGQVFVDGKSLAQQQTQSELMGTPGSWLVAADGKSMLVNLPSAISKPSDCLVELSVRNRIFCPRKRGLSFITVKGFTFEHCANQGPFPQGGAVSVRSGKNWVIEDNIIQYAKMVGLDCGSETWDVKNLKDTDDADKKLMLGGGHMIRNNVISDNGMCGIAGWNHKGTKIIGNILERNNRLHIDKPLAKWEEWGAIKLHCTDALIEGNLIKDNDEFGIWIDNGYGSAKIVRNVLINNQMAGVFLELGAGRCLIANNVIARTRSHGKFYKGFGVYSHDAADITVANNLIMENAGPAVLMRTITNRKFGGKLVRTSNEEIFNNIMLNNGGGICLPLEYERAKNNKSDHNFISYTGEETEFGFPWSLGGRDGKKVMDLADKKNETKIKRGSMDYWRQLTGNDKNSVCLPNGMKAKLDPTSYTLTIETSPALLALKCPVVKGTANDLCGEPISEAMVIVGPIQGLGSGKNTFKLWPLPERKSYFTSGLPKKQSDESIQSWSYGNGESSNSVWLQGKETQKNEPFSSGRKLSPRSEGMKLDSQSTGGVEKAPGTIILFKSPKTAWYDVKTAGKLVKRTNKTAGYCRLQLFLVSANDRMSELVKTVNLNTPGGFRSNIYPKEFELNQRVGIRKGCSLGMRFQVVSPGPANGGYGCLELAQLTVSELR